MTHRASTCLFVAALTAASIAAPPAMSADAPNPVQTKDAAKAPPKPTGSCTITVYGIAPTCTSAMTRDACNATAAKVGGVADWKEGKTCPPR